MKILYAASEVVPFAKTGGLADVAGALPPALARMGHDIRIVMPGYSSIDRTQFPSRPVFKEIVIHFPEGDQSACISSCSFPGAGFPVYFVEHPEYFSREGLYQAQGVDFEDNTDRFAFFCMAALWTIKGLDWRPDVIICNDWQTALIPICLRKSPVFLETPFFRNIKILFTIHNLAFQGLASPAYIPRLGLPLEIFNMEELEFYGHLNMLKGGIIYSDKINTVSSNYAQEIQTEQFGCGLDGVLRNRASDLVGIMNGIDINDWSPMRDRLIPANYSAEDLSGKAVCKAALQRKLKLTENPERPLIGVISRLTDQKGFDLIAEIIEPLIKLNAQFVLLGTGEKSYHFLFERAAAEHPGQISVNLKFDNQLAHEIEAGADIFLMPSRFEPCGLNQLYSMNYGTIPIGRKTGGLADSIVPHSAAKAAKGTATGFLFEEYSAKAFLAEIKKALKVYRTKPEAWRSMMITGMRQDFSWDSSAKKYDELMRKIEES